MSTSAMDWPPHSHMPPPTSVVHAGSVGGGGGVLAGGAVDQQLDIKPPPLVTSTALTSPPRPSLGTTVTMPPATAGAVPPPGGVLPPAMQLPGVLPPGVLQAAAVAGMPNSLAQTLASSMPGLTAGSCGAGGPSLLQAPTPAHQPPVSSMQGSSGGLVHPAPPPPPSHGSNSIMPPLMKGSASPTPHSDTSPEYDHEHEQDNGSTDLSNDAEGVWSPDIEQSFHEALQIYPPCGRRKIILSEEGKMYGRNELIARYIKLRTGKSRSRKQVSSHIQVLARRKSREISNKIKDENTKQKTLQNLQSMSSAQIVSNNFALNNPYNHAPPFWPLQDVSKSFMGSQSSSMEMLPTASHDPRCLVGTPAFQLTEFSAFVETTGDDEPCTKHLYVHIGPPFNNPIVEAVDIKQIQDKFMEEENGLKSLFDKGPQEAFFLVKFWADLNSNIQEECSKFYGVTHFYESTENLTIQCSTKLLSFGKQVVEKVETAYSKCEGGRYIYTISRSPMCEYMINFILKLTQLPEQYMMNSVLENFTVLQIVRNQDTGATMLCMAYVFEVSTSEHGAQHHVYRLVKD